MLQQMTYQQAYDYCSKQSDTWLMQKLLLGKQRGLDHQVRLCAEILVERGYTGQVIYDPFGDPTVEDAIQVELVAGFKDWLKEAK